MGGLRYIMQKIAINPVYFFVKIIMATLLNISLNYRTNAYNVCKAVDLYTTWIEFMSGDKVYF